MVGDGEQKFKAGIFFGSGVKLVSEDDYLSELAHEGLTRQGFRKLCRGLQVPLIFIGRRCYVDLMSFCLAMRAVVRVGQPDFYFPGSEPIVHAKKEGARDAKWFEEQFEEVLAELLVARKVANLKITREWPQLAKEASKRMVALGMHMLPLSQQKEYDRVALRDLKKELPDLDVRVADVNGTDKGEAKLWGMGRYTKKEMRDRRENRLLGVPDVARRS